MPLRFRARPSASAVGMAVTVFACIIFEVTSVAEGDRDEPHKFTIEELVSSHFEHKDSGDLGMDPCKAGK